MQGNTVSANKQCCAASGKPATHLAKEALCWTSAYKGCPFAVGTTAFQTATSSARQHGFSKQTVLRRLRQAQQPIWPRKPYVGPVLTRAARLQWAQRQFCWGRQQWARFADYSLIERDRFGGGSVRVWGGIMGRRKINLIVVQGNLNAQGYINQILQLFLSFKGMGLQY